MDGDNVTKYQVIRLCTYNQPPPLKKRTGTKVQTHKQIYMTYDLVFFNISCIYFKHIEKDKEI